MAEGNSLKWPPKLDNEGSYETWKNDIEIWSKLTDLKVNKQALAIHLTLTGKARLATSEIKAEDLNKDDGVALVLKKLDELFLKDTGRRQFMAFKEIYGLRRAANQSVAEFIPLFEHSYYKFKQESMSLPDPVVAFMLLASCQLSDSELRLVMSAINEVTFDVMKLTLKRVFDIGLSRNEGAIEPVVKEEVLINRDENTKADEGENAFYSRGWSTRGRRSRRFDNRGGHGYRGDSYMRGRSNYRSRGQAAYTDQQASNFGGSQFSRGGNTSDGRRKLNPVARDGEISKCAICQSIFHWARQCPDSYECMESDKNDVENKVDENLSMFVAYTNGENRDEKPVSLLEESFGHGIIDTGCFTTVCGEKWLSNYIDSLSEFDRRSVKENSSKASFTFGDGRKFMSVRSVNLPCRIGDFSGNITTEVVSADIPLLFSKTSMKRVKMIINTENDSVTIRGKQVNLRTASTGHYMIGFSI